MSRKLSGQSGSDIVYVVFTFPFQKLNFEFKLSTEESFILFLYHWLDTSDQKLQRKTSIESPHEEWVLVSQQWSSRSEKPSTYVLQRPWIRNEFLSVSYLTHRRLICTLFSTIDVKHKTKKEKQIILIRHE